MKAAGLSPSPFAKELESEIGSSMASASLVMIIRFSVVLCEILESISDFGGFVPR
jgi:hypothetical protein